MIKPKVSFVGPLERVLSLRTLPMFELLSAEELTAVAQHAHEKYFPRGSVLLNANQPTTAAYVVLAGAVEVRRAHGVEEIGPNESVGFVDLFARSLTGVDARATADTETLELDWDAQLDVCEQYFRILAQYVSFLCKRCITHLGLTELDPGRRQDTLPAIRDRPLNLVERALVFRNSRVFSSCGADALWELTRHVTEVRWSAGERIWDQGQAARHFLLLVHGSVQCQDDAHSVIVQEPGATLGMYESMSTQMRWYRATTVTPTIALRVDDESFLDILEDHFDAAIEYTATIARELVHSSIGNAVQQPLDGPGS